MIEEVCKNCLCYIHSTGMCINNEEYYDEDDSCDYFMEDEGIDILEDIEGLKI